MKINLRVGPIGKLFAPGYGSCRRCRTPWLFVQYHITGYKLGHGCFALCKKCWNELTPIHRIPFYYELIQSWHVQYPPPDLPFDEQWSQVETAVLNDA